MQAYSSPHIFVVALSPTLLVTTMLTCSLLKHTTVITSCLNLGKYIKLQYGKNWKLGGARTLPFLLEKSRLVHQEQNERNYHVFYQLCKGVRASLPLSRHRCWSRIGVVAAGIAVAAAAAASVVIIDIDVVGVGAGIVVHATVAAVSMPPLPPIKHCRSHYRRRRC